MRTGCGAALAAWLTMKLVQGQVPVGWLGSREGQVLTRRPRRVHPRQVAGVMADHGLDQEVVTTLRGR
jgi:hypothetical protein